MGLGTDSLDIIIYDELAVPLCHGCECENGQHHMVWQLHSFSLMILICSVFTLIALEVTDLLDPCLAWKRMSS
jgi:hypothetical protein